MNNSQIKEFDLTVPADNGLKRGRTTGTCAAGAVKAALLLMQHGEHCESVPVILPGGEYFMTVPVTNLHILPDGSVRAEVVKYAGDDPDQTDGATIFAEVRRNGSCENRFLAGAGVGVVTEPGLSVAIGQPAINPVPRAMMEEAVMEICGSRHKGFDLTIGCERGAEIAKKTFNPRLGITGGISILGTTGVVEPMSLAAYKASIEVYIRVALGGAPAAIALRPGNVGISFARDRLNLPPKRIVHISNFIGFSLEATERILKQECRTIETLWVLGHPGKLCKILQGIWDTHSSKSPMAMSTMASVAGDLGFEFNLVNQIASCNTTEAVLGVLAGQANADTLWVELERRLEASMHKLVPSAGRVAVRLFAMNGSALGQAKSESTTGQPHD